MDRFSARTTPVPKKATWILFIGVRGVDIAQRNYLLGRKFPKSIPITSIEKCPRHLAKAYRLAHKRVRVVEALILMTF